MRLNQVAVSIVKLTDEISMMEGNVPDREISRMMRELTDLNSLYTRLIRKRSKRKMSKREFLSCMNHP